jgi:hypothetical protein
LAWVATIAQHRIVTSGAFSHQGQTAELILNDQETIRAVASVYWPRLNAHNLTKVHFEQLEAA